MALTTQQELNNRLLDMDIRRTEREYQLYLDDLSRQKEQFIKDNPLFPKDIMDCMFLPVCGPRQVIGIRYIE